MSELRVGNNDANKIHKITKHSKNLVVGNILRIEFGGMIVGIISRNKCRLRGYCVLLRGYCTELCSARCAEN